MITRVEPTHKKLMYIEYTSDNVKCNIWMKVTVFQNVALCSLVEVR
jgi:hypothetical protein